MIWLVENCCIFTEDQKAISYVHLATVMVFTLVLCVTHYETQTSFQLQIEDLFVPQEIPHIWVK